MARMDPLFSTTGAGVFRSTNQVELANWMNAVDATHSWVFSTPTETGESAEANLGIVRDRYGNLIFRDELNVDPGMPDEGLPNLPSDPYEGQHFPNTWAPGYGPYPYDQATSPSERGELLGMDVWNRQNANRFVTPIDVPQGDENNPFVLRLAPDGTLFIETSGSEPRRFTEVVQRLINTISSGGELGPNQLALVQSMTPAQRLAAGIFLSPNGSVLTPSEVTAAALINLANGNPLNANQQAALGLAFRNISELWRSARRDHEHIAVDRH